MRACGALIASIVVSIVGVAGCAPWVTTRAVTLADGQAATGIECRKESLCLSEAQRVCPGGYLVLAAGAHADNGEVRGWATSRPYAGRMLIRCQ